MPQCFTYLCLSTTSYLKCYSPVPLVEGEGPASYCRDLDMFIPSGATRQQVTGRKPGRDHCVKSEGNVLAGGCDMKSWPP